MPTALELGPEGWKPYLRGARERTRTKTSSRDEAARSDVVVRARQAAEVLKKDYGGRRVVLFGSLAHQAWFGSSSDVDLAVEGLPPGAYWGAWRAVETCFPGRTVDLIEYETASESLRQAIDREGIPL